MTTQHQTQTPPSGPSGGQPSGGQGGSAEQHRPAPGRPVPVSTYRLQVRPEFTYDDASAVVDHLDALGASHAYLSPLLAPAPGSAHGYDVVDHSRFNPEAGGREAFEVLVDRLHERSLGAVADVVPNHMAVPTPARLNGALWSVLRDGPDSPFARWFDVDWWASGHAILMPVLGSRIGQVLGSGELELDTSGSEPLLRYYDHVFPVRPGTESLPLAELVDRQWYRLAHWRVADEELNYRRFFDVDTLAAIRVEDPEVFDATHELLLGLIDEGKLDGLRIDHPDGLADPRGYVRRLSERSGGAWVVVEKILEGSEDLPDDWPVAGTTGYDALLRVGGLFVDPAGASPLSALMAEVTGRPRASPPSWSRPSARWSRAACTPRCTAWCSCWCRWSPSTSACATTPSEPCATAWSSCSWPSPGTAPTWCRASPRPPRPSASWTRPLRTPGRTCPRSAGTPSRSSSTCCWAARPAAPAGSPTATGRS